MLFWDTVHAFAYAYASILSFFYILTGSQRYFLLQFAYKRLFLVIDRLFVNMLRIFFLIFFRMVYDAYNVRIH